MSQRAPVLERCRQIVSVQSLRARSAKVGAMNDSDMGDGPPACPLRQVSSRTPSSIF